MEQGFLIKTKITVKHIFKKAEVKGVWIVRDGDLPFVPQPYHRIADRVYATQNKQHASVWVHEKACETYMNKHKINGSIVSATVADTGMVTNDGRKLLMTA